MLECLVLCVRGEQHQVLLPIVRRIVIDVMHALRSRQWSPNLQCHHKTMLHDIAVRAGHAH
jgi:hypothetical protein